MTDSEAQQEAVVQRVRDRLVARIHAHRVSRVDVGDAGCDHEGASGNPEQGCMRHRVAAHRLGDPQGTEPQLFDLCREFLRPSDGNAVESPGPQTDGAEIKGHICSVHPLADLANLSAWWRWIATVAR